MRSRIMRRSGETVTVVHLSTDKDEEIIAGDILCLINPVQDKHDHWQAVLDIANRDIRKGDILRREDGTELQVLRSVTAKGSRMGEITQLDLKDYDRQNSPLEKSEVNAL